MGTTEADAAEQAQPLENVSSGDVTGYAWKDVPDSMGFWWIRKRNGSKQLLFLEENAYFEENNVIDCWICPGARRYRLNWHSMPDWAWAPCRYPGEPK